MKNNKKSKNEHSNMKWVIQSFIMTFILSMIFAYVSTNGVSNLSLIPALLILILVIYQHFALYSYLIALIYLN